MSTSLANLLGVLGLTMAIAACSAKPCEETCRRVASCRLEAKQGEKMLGEGSPPADPKCLARCEAQVPDFAPCEGKYRECKAVLACLPY